MEIVAWIVAGTLLLALVAVVLSSQRQRGAAREAMAAEREAAKTALERERAAGRAALARYSAIIDMERAVAEARATLEATQARTVAERGEYEEQRARLKTEYEAAKAIFDRLSAQVGSLEENLEDISFGIYKPHYDFDSPERYRSELEGIRGRQKELIRAGLAGRALVEWSVGGSRKDGERMQKQYLKLMLRAFNGECDASIARVSWNNIVKMEERIRKSLEAINALGGVMQMEITRPYLDLKLAELRLEHEYEEKKRAELEEQRRIREQMREEERALKEAEKAKAEAEAEEARSVKALEKAQAELAVATGHALDQLQERIGHLDTALRRARELKDRATTMAQLTRAGHVYIISNVGSFGEDVFKIGMTRRLEPVQRIRELGDASVPFEFDIHAMVYSEDAPGLEGRFHSAFAERAMNLVNPRKEFFAVSLDEVERVATENGLQVQFTRLAEARDYRQTLAKREAIAKRAGVVLLDAPSQVFPDTV